MRLAARHRHALRISPSPWDVCDSFPGRFTGQEVVRMGSGDPIVLLPGLAGGWRLMAPLARELSRRHEVILIGLRGDTGFSGPCPRQKPIDHAMELVETLGQLGLERPTIFGVSYGAAVALELAVQEPQMLGGLILFGGDEQFRMNLGATIALRALEGFPLPRNSRFLNQFFNILHGCRPEPGPIVDFIVNTCWETDQGVVASRLRGLEGFSVEDRLWGIDTPALVVAGSRDVVVPPSHQKSLCRKLTGARFETIDGAGHVGFVTHKKAVAQLAGHFVRDRLQRVF